METAILFILVLGLLFVGVPVAVSLGLSSIILIAFFSNDSMSSVAMQLFTASQNYTLLAIPFFVLASAFMSTGGVAKRIIRFAIATVGHFRGGLAMASVLACMLFAALSGSSPATVVAIGTIAIAGMRQVGYSKEFAAGIIANAGTLGILIPPSIVMVVYAAATDVSVGRMFLAGVIPGILAGLMLMIAIYVVARIKNLPAEPWRGFGEIVAGGKEAGWGLFLIIIIIGGIYGGVFTPTEAAAVAAVYSFFIAVFIYRDMGPMAGITWVNETDSRRARAGFSGLVYALAFYFVWMILSFFATSGWETVTFAGRSNLGLAISLFILVAYTAWRGEKGLAGVPCGADGRLAYLGPQPVADGPEFRPRLVQRRHPQGDGRRFQDHHHADVHHRQRAAVRPCADVRTHSRGHHRPDARLRLQLVHLPDRGQPAVDAADSSWNRRACC
jgi:C4-dicarboxylate transporter DctM subunit